MSQAAAGAEAEAAVETGTVVGTATGVALVTGAGSGLGRAIAQALLGAGWQVGLLGRHAAPLEETAAGQSGALVVPTDVTDEAAVADAFAAVLAAFGRVDLLVNNAGSFGPAGEPDQVAVQQWRQ
ncbi:MAG: SDR family NAD(P)-dependent oxidoreductase, partial [Dermatophilaceae bacterium]